jgi:hypothetical protein
MTNTELKPKAKNFNKYAYTVFVMAGILFLALKDYGQAAAFIGISLAFDPFDQAVRFDKRPIWQRIWLIVHLVTSLTAFILVLKNGL